MVLDGRRRGREDISEGTCTKRLRHIENGNSCDSQSNGKRDRDEYHRCGNIHGLPTGSKDDRRYGKGRRKSGFVDVVVPVMNKLKSCKIAWIAGHQGIRGNEIADRMAKKGLEGGIDWGYWDKWKGINEKGRWEKEMRKKEWEEWCIEEGYEYYKRKPGKPNHWKGLERLDIYVLLRLRAGVDSMGHLKCENPYERHHMVKCDKTKEGRPDISTLYQDKKIGDWVVWWKRMEYFGWGIPSTTNEQLENCRVMFGNPFDGTITIERNGEVVVEMVTKPPCDGCGRTHRGPCLKRVADMRGRYFYAGESIECRICGSKFGGGSTIRPGGSGLSRHLARNSCGREWEKLFWKEEMERKEEWEADYRLAMGIKWSELWCKGVLNCWGCNKGYKSIQGLRMHVRTEEDCFKVLEGLMMDNPTGWD
ncbi:hypothetical protein HOY82DRAFT_542949 [Tuber indicum]|nr:hypothetical protein HOY82DRAFT_542949 [Tuber indicum]